MNMDMSKNDSRRVELLGIKGKYLSGGTESFDNLDVDTLRLLIEEGYADPEMNQNDSHTTNEFYEFMLKHPDIKAHGYAVSPDRDDYRMTIEGLSGEPTNDMETVADFIKLCRWADACSIEDGLYSWWD